MWSVGRNTRDFDAEKESLSVGNIHRDAWEGCRCRGGCGTGRAAERESVYGIQRLLRSKARQSKPISCEALEGYRNDFSTRLRYLNHHSRSENLATQQKADKSIMGELIDQGVRIPAQIPFVDLIVPHLELQEELLEVFRAALRTGTFVGGSMVEDFEREFARY